MSEALWLKRAETQESEEGREFCLHQAEQARLNAEKRNSDQARLRTESAKRRRMETSIQEEGRREELGYIRDMEAQFLTEEQRLEMTMARLRRNMAENPAVHRDPLNENAMDIKHLFRLSRMMMKTPWMQALWPYITLSSKTPTHRIYTRTMKTICLSTTLENRAKVLDLFDELQRSHGFLELHMIQELMFEQNIMPFFDIEPNEKLYMDNLCRRSNDNGPAPRPELELVLALVASLFTNWPALAWMVWRRESETGWRYHIRVRGLDGGCVLINRHKLKKRVELGRFNPTERCKIPTRDWIGLDPKPYDGQMRFSNSIKCDDPEALARDVVYGTDNRRSYTYFQTYRVEMGIMKEVMTTDHWPYHPRDSRGACSLPFAGSRKLVPQRVPDPSTQNIVTIWQQYAASMPKFTLPQHEHLGPRTFSWNWRPGRSLESALFTVDAELSPEDTFAAWKRIANHYVRVLRSPKMTFFVLTPQAPGPKDVNTKEGFVEENEQYKLEEMTSTEFSAAYKTFVKKWKEGRETKAVTFAQLVEKSSDLAIDSALFRQLPQRKPDSKVFNKWCGPGVTPDESIRWVANNKEKAKLAVHLFLEHLMWLCGNRHKNAKVDRYNMWAFTVLLHFTRKVLVDPFDRHAWEFILIMQGEPGCGKGTYWKLLQTLVSLALTHRVEGDESAKRQAEQFNAVFARHLLTLLDEPTKLPMNLINSFKTMVTEGMIGAEDKYQGNKMSQNLAHILIFFNRLKKLPQLDQGERRIIITEGINHPRRREFFNKVYEVLEGDKGYHAVAAYLYTLKDNPLWRSTMGNQPYVGPLKAMMMDNSKPVVNTLLINARVPDWTKTGDMLFVFKEQEINNDHMGWRFFLEAEQQKHKNHWVWHAMGEGFDEEWPPFIPLSGLVMVMSQKKASTEAINKMQADITENLKTIWPEYVSRTWNHSHEIYGDMEPVMEVSSLMERIRRLYFRQVGNKWIHRNCRAPMEGLNATCCDENPWVKEVFGWYVWRGEPKFHTISGKVLLLPRKADAEEFYSQLFSTISEIPSVHFPQNWQLGRWEAFVDALGNEGSIEALEEEDERAYFNFEGVELGPDTGGHSLAIADEQ